MSVISLHVAVDTETGELHIEEMNALPVDSDANVFDDPEWREPTDEERGIAIEAEHRLGVLFDAEGVVEKAALMAGALDNALMEEGNHFSCSEYESILDVFRALGFDVSAYLSKESAHVRSDEEDDEHYIEPTEEDPS